MGPVTRPHSSANSLRKPFKTPFKVPGDPVAKANDRDRQPEQVIPSPPVENQHALKDDESEDDVEIVEVHIKQEPDDTADDQRKPHYSRSQHSHRNHVSHTDMVIPEVTMEVEVSFSRKVPVRDVLFIVGYDARSRTRGHA
jgi:hypothetical protein